VVFGAGVAVEGAAVTACTGAGAAAPGRPAWLYHSSATTPQTTTSATANATMLPVFFIS
jgi:type IV secretory pathway TrbL component